MAKVIGPVASAPENIPLEMGIYTKIIIIDNGHGMDDESLSKLFEPYFTNKPNGNGLGLTNTQNIILNHKGDITVQSKRNEGTSFIITLDFAK